MFAMSCEYIRTPFFSRLVSSQPPGPSGLGASPIYLGFRKTSWPPSQFLWDSDHFPTINSG
jgi:hypothetical protein